MATFFCQQYKFQNIKAAPWKIYWCWTWWNLLFSIFPLFHVALDMKSISIHIFKWCAKRIYEFETRNSLHFCYLHNANEFQLWYWYVIIINTKSQTSHTPFLTIHPFLAMNDYQYLLNSDETHAQNWWFSFRLITLKVFSNPSSENMNAKCRHIHTCNAFPLKPSAHSHHKLTMNTIE